MLTKAIVDKVIDTNAIRVRIPVFNKASYNVNATPSEELYVATVCTLPNCEIPFQVGDVVIVGFEDNQASKPVIIGYLFRKTDYLCKADLKLSSLIVDGNVKFSNEISIGEINYNDILKLKGIKDNIQQQLDILTNRINMLMYGNSTSSGSADTPTVDPSPDNGEDAVDPGTGDSTDTPVEDDFVELENSDFYENYNITSTGIKPYDLYKNTKIYDNPNPNHLHISSLYGEVRSNGSTHYAVDCQNCNDNFNNAEYDVLLSPAKGKIIHKYVEADNSGYGNGFIIEYGRNYTVLFAHMKATDTHNALSVGTIVTAGQMIGRQGDTGTSSGEHLHLAVYKNGVVKEPYAVLFGDWQLPDYGGE